MTRIKSERRELDALSGGTVPPDMAAFNAAIDQIITTLDQCETLMNTGDRMDIMRSMVRLQRLLKDVGEDGRRLIEAEEKRLRSRTNQSWSC